MQGPPDGLIAPPSAAARPQDNRPIIPQPAAPVATPANPPAASTNAPQDVRPLPPRNSPRTTAVPSRPATNAPQVAPASPARADQPPAPETSPDVADTSTAAIDAAPTLIAPDSGSDNGWSSFTPFAAGAIMLLGGIFWWLRRRKAAERAAVMEAPYVAPPSPNPTPQAKADPRPPAPTLVRGGKRAKIEVDFTPLHASTTLINFRLRYAIDIRNDGELDAADVRVRIGLFAGNQTNAASIGHWFELDEQEVHHVIATLSAGESTQVEGELAAPIAAIGTFRQGNRQGAIPILAIDCRYGHAAGDSPIDAVTAKAFVLGCENAEQDADANKRLAPLPIDLGPSNFNPLGVRDTGIAKRR